MHQRFFISIGLLIASFVAGCAKERAFPEAALNVASCAKEHASPEAALNVADCAKEHASPEAALNRLGNFMRAGDQLAAEEMTLPSREYGNKRESDEMHRWVAGQLDFVILGQHRQGNFAIFPIVWTGNNATDAKVLVLREGTWKICWLPDYKVLTGYDWTHEERGELQALLTWFYDHRSEFNALAAQTYANQAKLRMLPLGQLHHGGTMTDEDRRQRGLQQTKP